MYGYGSPPERKCKPENSLEELEMYRAQYAAFIQKLTPPGELDWTARSHLCETLWLVLSNPVSYQCIMYKQFHHLFPEEERINKALSSDREEKISSELYIIDVAEDLAGEGLGPKKAERLPEALWHFFWELKIVV